MRRRGLGRYAVGGAYGLILACIDCRHPFTWIDRMRPPSSANLDFPKLDFDREYIAKLVDLEKRENADDVRYDDNGNQVDPSRVIWKLELTDPTTGEVILRRGKGGEMVPFEVWAWTSTSTYFDPNGTMTSRGRQYMHALIGKRLSDEEVTELITGEDGNPDLPFALCGKKALVELRKYTSNGRERIGITEMRRLPPPPTSQTKQQRLTETPDDDDLPFK